MTIARHGKRAVHNWAKLPTEILRLVVANYLAYRPHFYLPSSWLHPEYHYQRAIFEALRDANDIQQLMAVCPQWHRALLNLDFWVAVCRRLDRHDILGRSMLTREAQAAALAGSANAHMNVRLVRNYNHFRFLSQACCLPCRVNRPNTKEGIGHVKTTLATSPFGQVPVCKLHRNNSFCGVCLKDISTASIGERGQPLRVPESLFENEDFETWPTVHTTCFHCRRDALVRTAAMYSNPQLNLLEFLGGPSLNTKDYEARSVVDSFVDMAEGGINEVINTLLERHWLRANTNLGSLLDQAVASVRYSRAEFEEYESEDEMISDEEDADTYEMMQSQEELGGVRNLAITAWARGRIMDGNWVSPGDIWCLGMGQIAPDSQWDPSYLPPTLHPVPYSLQPSPSNESASLSTSEVDEGVCAELPSSLQEGVHYPAPDRNTPLPNYRLAQIAANIFRATFRDILLDPMRHIVARLMHEAQEAHQDPCVRVARLDMESVLAFLREERTWYVSAGGSPRLMHAIPYVPTSTQNFSPHTRSLFENLWREACLPLFQCQCRICDRAMRSQGQSTRSSVLQSVVAQTPTPVVPSQQPQQQIVLVEREVTPDAIVNASPPTVPSAPPSDTDSRSRKRSSAELDDPEEIDETDGGVSPGGTPRKRQRTGEKDANVDDDAAMSSSDASHDADSPVEIESGGGTGPGSPTNSVPSETSLSSSSASDSSSLRSVASSTPLPGLAALEKIRTTFKELTAQKVKVHGHDEDAMFEDPEDGIVYLH